MNKDLNVAQGALGAGLDKTEQEPGSVNKIFLLAFQYCDILHLLCHDAGAMTGYMTISYRIISYV